MDYWELRKQVKKLVPRQNVLSPQQTKMGIKEKGRKSNYHQFHIKDQEWKKLERLLNEEEVSNFLEVSLRAQACPMPLNLDVWDGLKCPYGCKYCFADSFRATLYTAFFDNSRSMGIRHCNPDYYKREMDKLFSNIGKKPGEVSGEVQRAICGKIPIRFGIRFEDFAAKEGRSGISLELLRYLKEASYPVMINTKSRLVGREEYVRVLSENKAGAAVHITMISSNESFLRRIEPGAPSFAARIAAAGELVDAGVRVVARIEPFMTFLNDQEDEVRGYMEALKDAGVNHITFDNYSYSANSPGIRNNFYQLGIDFDRMFSLMSDSQGIGSLLLDSFMGEFRKEGFKCSSFDMGCVPENDQDVCCEVGDLFLERGAGLNYGCAVMAVRFIQEQKGKPVNWGDYYNHVHQHGGFLSDRLELEMKRLWNMNGNPAYFISWAPGIIPKGQDADGMVWAYSGTEPDFRKNLLEGALG